MKKNLALILVATMCVGLFAGCGKTETKTNQTEEKKYDKEAIADIRSGLDKLNNYDKSYIITTQLDEPKSTSEFLTVVDGDVNYTEYSVDEEGNYGTITYGSQESVSYTLSDYVDKDGNYVILAGDDEENPYYTISDDYSKLISNRKNMWVEYMIDKFTECYKYTTTTITLLDKDVDITLYQCKLPSKDIQTILGVGSVGIYDAIINNTKDENIKKLFQYYYDTSAYTLACSDANVLVGVDSNGYLCYVGIEVGGLGTNLYYTSVVVNMDNTEIRDAIDTSTAKNFETLYTELAEYCSQYDTIEEAMESMAQSSSTEDSNLNLDTSDISIDENTNDIEDTTETTDN